jgi:hypothetical protein
MKIEKFYICGCKKGDRGPSCMIEWRVVRDGYAISGHALKSRAIECKKAIERAERV